MNESKRQRARYLAMRKQFKELPPCPADCNCAHCTGRVFVLRPGGVHYELFRSLSPGLQEAVLAKYKGDTNAT